MLASPQHRTCWEFEDNIESVFCRKEETSIFHVLAELKSFVPVWVFFHEHSQITGLQGKWECRSLTPDNYFHLLYRRLDISRAITVDFRELISTHSQHPDLNRKPLVFEGKSLTSKLRALKRHYNERDVHILIMHY